MADLAGLFAPERVAVVGATDREGAIGTALMRNLLADFDGEVVGVNPGRDSVMGVPCVDNLQAAGTVDLAVVAVPAPAVLDVVRDAAEAGVENVVVITAGFAETGGEGVERERELARLAADHDLNLVGPNCLGVVSTAVGLNATFAPTNAQPGSLSFLSQSGAVVTSVLDWANDRGVGFRNVVSLGNKTVLDEVDFIEAWDDDPGTDVILGYLESIEDGQAFVERVRAVTQSTPVLLVKGGRTEVGAQAAASHTGAIAGSERAYAAGLARAGVLRASSLEALFDWARALAGQPLPSGDGVGIVSNAGGLGVLAADALGDTPLSLASFAGDTVETVEAVLPPDATAGNPLDVIGDADVDRFRTAIEAVAADPNVGAVAVLSAPSALLDYEALAAAIVETRADAGVPVVTCLMGGERVRAAERVLRDAGIPNYPDPGRAVGSLGALADHRDVTRRSSVEPERFPVDRDRAAAVIDRARRRATPALGVEALELLDAYGIPTPAGEVVDAPEAAVDAADAIDGPVVMKIVSPDILHKTDIGGVRVGVERADVADAFEALVARAHSYQPDATVLGVLVQEQVDVDAGVETIVGMNRDPQFGPLLLFGLGGVFVEVLEDTAVRLAPVSEPEARAMTEDIRSAPLLRGARGREPVDLDAVVETVQRLSQLVIDLPAVLELDINPLVATPGGVSAVDLRLTVDTEQL
ncbi:MAG: acetate--CoA ligase family protein [Halobacteriales archaeon]